MPSQLKELSIQLLKLFSHPINLSKCNFFFSSLFHSKNGNPIDGDSECEAKAAENSFSKNQDGLSHKHWCPKRPLCSLCWRIQEEVCDSNCLLELPFIPRLAKPGWGRIWIWTSHGRSHYSMQWRILHQFNFSSKLLISTWPDTNYQRESETAKPVS
jgi:hypothetical protein